MAIESVGNEISLIGNEGFRLRAGAAEIYIDAFYHPIPGVASAPVLRGKDVAKADLILVTHGTWTISSPARRRKSRVAPARPSPGPAR